MQEPKDPKMSGRVALVVLLGLAAVTTLMVWVAR